MPAAPERVIDIETWKEWQAAGHRAQLVDVRSATEFATAHLPGAINIPLEQIELRTADLEVNTPVVLVCQGEPALVWPANCWQPAVRTWLFLKAERAPGSRPGIRPSAPRRLDGHWSGRYG